ncbi:MAG: hypothetical protein AAFX93_02250 [Verrucomicrobiota bacterium]
MNIYKRKREGRAKPWEACWYVDRKRKSRFFATKKERDAWIKQNGKEGGLDTWQEIREKCEEFGIDPLHIINDYIRTNFPNDRVTINQAVDDLLESKEHRDKSYLCHLSGFLQKKFVPEFSHLAPHQIDSHKIRNFLNGLTSHPVTFRNYRNYLRIFFNFCEREKWIVNNPVKHVPLLEAPPEEIRFHKPKEVKLLLESARTSEKQILRDMLPLLALQAFAGIRSETAYKMEWDMIDFDRKEIVIPAAIMKKRRKHIMQGLEDNLWHWLNICDQSKELSMTARAFRHRKRQVLDLSGVEDIKNGLRHSFATYHVTLHQSADKTALLMPHRSATELWEHYYGAGRSTDAKAYFEIVP